jgi:hypothetical protein
MVSRNRKQAQRYGSIFCLVNITLPAIYEPNKSKIRRSSLFWTWDKKSLEVWNHLRFIVVTTKLSNVQLGLVDKSNGVGFGPRALNNFPNSLGGALGIKSAIPSG